MSPITRVNCVAPGFVPTHFADFLTRSKEAVSNCLHSISYLLIPCFFLIFLSSFIFLSYPFFTFVLHLSSLCRVVYLLRFIGSTVFFQHAYTFKIVLCNAQFALPFALRQSSHTVAGFFICRSHSQWTNIYTQSKPFCSAISVVSNGLFA